MTAAIDQLLGLDPHQRVRLSRSLAAAAIYLVCLVIEFSAVSVGMADIANAFALSIFILIGVVGFYVALRSGWSLRWADPALTMPQVVFALVIIALAYAINPAMRGMVAMLMALVLVFCAFILPPRRCLQMGLLSVAFLTIAILVSISRSPTLFEPRIELFHFLLAALVLPAIAVLAGQLSALRIQQKEQKLELRAALDKVHRLATHDELTGLPNRRQAQSLMDREESKALRHEAHMCICVIDIDNFKRVNDTMGHQAGDDALRMFSAILSSDMRTGDVLARWGGEEFMLLFPATMIKEAMQVMERLRLRCADPVNWVERPDLQVTFSAGLSVIAAGESIQLAIARADSALYKAKNGGRNRVLIG